MKRIIDLKGFQRLIYLPVNFSALVSLKVSIPVGLGSSFEIDSFNLCLNTLKVKISNELFIIWRLQINFDTCKYYLQHNEIVWSSHNIEPV